MASKGHLQGLRTHNWKLIMRVNSLYILIVLLLSAAGVFLDAPIAEGGRPQEWFGDPKWANYTEFNISDSSIRLAWITPFNSGFHYSTIIEKCRRNNTALAKSKLSLYPTWTNHSYFYDNYLADKYWLDC